MLNRGVLLKRSVLLKGGRNRPAPDLASRQDACYKVAGTPSTNCIPATPHRAFVGRDQRWPRDKTRTLDEAVIAASPVVFQL
jgi:hypothetical protein